MDEKEKRKESFPEEEGQRTIRNRDVILLSHVLYTIQDVSNTEQMRQWQQDRLYSMTQRITGMPGGGGKGQDMGDKMADIGELEEKYAKQFTKYLRELKSMEIILNRIKSREMQTFVIMRYVFGMENNKIMTALNMKRRKFEQACKAVEQAPDMEHVVWRERFVLKG
jgi:hypothetical protein